VLVVVVDTSTPAVTAAVAEVTPISVQVLAQRITVDGQRHGELLAPSLRAALDEAGARAADLAAVVVGLGPGPFTGLRVGLVTAAALTQALVIPAYGVCSLDGIGAQTMGSTLVATDARRKEIYWGVYRGGVALTAPAVDRPARVAELLSGTEVEVAIGDGAQKYAAVLPFPVLDSPRFPSALALAQLAADRVRQRGTSETPPPAYLRRPDATQPHAPTPVMP
jgi:tRNA threonylcarbamoyl adenosine modification protein YeaZ